MWNAILAGFECAWDEIALPPLIRLPVVVGLAPVIAGMSVAGWVWERMNGGE